MTFHPRAVKIALLCAAAVPTGAWAQDQAPQIGNETGLSNDFGDIIVTAQRRSERLRDVPMSITALSSEVLTKAGVNNILDIQRISPGVNLPMFGGFLMPSIRGVSSSGSGLGDQSNVAIYVDGVYQPSMSGQLLDLPDVEQVEILKGPQGTLYGQNAAGGAIIITSITPQFDFGGRISASYGNYNDKSVRGYVTGPIAGDVAAFALSASYQDRDGFRTNVVTGKRNEGLESVMVRGRLLLQPSDDLSFTLGGHYSLRKDRGIYAGQPVGEGTPLGYAIADLAGLTVPKPRNKDEYALSVEPLTEIESYGFNLRMELVGEGGTLSTTSAYGNVRVLDIADADYTAVNVGLVNDLSIYNEHFIQEVNFASEKFGRATFSTGLFFMALKERYDPNQFQGYFLAPGNPVTIGQPLPDPLFLVDQRASNKKRSYAAYAEIGYDLTDSLNLTLGGRYAYEEQTTEDNYGSGTVLFPDPRGTIGFSRFTPRATLRYAIDPMSNIYASYAQGFKSGYVNSGDPNGLPFSEIPDAVQPEKVYSYEIGYKGNPIDGVNVNLAAFWIDYKDLQVYTYTPPTEFYQNAAAARIRGIEADISVRVAEGLTINAAGAYLDAKYRNFPEARVFVPNAFGFGYDSVSFDASGVRMQRAPKFSGNLTVNYETDLNAGTVGAFLSGSYSSPVKFDPLGAVRQDAYATLSAELSFSPATMEGLRLVLWGKNLTNKAYISSALQSNFVLGAAYSDPRTYGVRAEFAF